MVGCRNCNQPLNPQWNVCPNCSTPVSGINIQDSVVMGNVSNTNVTNVNQVIQTKRIVVPEGPVTVSMWGINYTKPTYVFVWILEVSFFIFMAFQLDENSQPWAPYLCGGAFFISFLEIIWAMNSFERKTSQRVKLMNELRSK